MISELPVGSWTQTYKDFEDKDVELETTLSRSFAKITPFKLNFTSSSDAAFNKVAMMSPAQIRKKFRLETTISTTNMVAFSSQGKLAKYKTPIDIVKEFFPVRREYYRKRHASYRETGG